LNNLYWSLLSISWSNQRLSHAWSGANLQPHHTKKSPINEQKLPTSRYLLFFRIHHVFSSWRDTS